MGSPAGVRASGARAHAAPEAVPSSPRSQAAPPKATVSFFRGPYGQGLLLAVAAALLAAGLLWPPSTLPRDGAATLGIVLCTVVLWIGQLLPMSVTALIAVALLLSSGVAADFRTAAIGFAMDTVFFVLAVNLLARAVVEAGLMDRISRAVQRLTGGDPRHTLWMLTAINQLTAVVMPSALVRLKTYLPVIRSVHERSGLDAEEGRRFLAASGLVLSLLGPVATAGLMTGGAVSIVAARTIAEFHKPITWLQWLLLMMPASLVIMALMSWYVQRVFLGKPSGSSVAAASRAVSSGEAISSGEAVSSAEAISRGEAGSGVEAVSAAKQAAATAAGAAGENTPRPWSRQERIVVAVLIFTLSLWLVGSRWDIPLALPAILAVTILSLPQIRLVTRETVQRQGWDEIMVIGAALSLSHALSETGAIQWIADQVFSILPERPGPWAVYVLVVGFAVVVRQFFLLPSPAVAVTMPVILELGRITGTNPLFLGMLNAGVLSILQMLPVQSPPSLVVYTEGIITTADLLRVAPFLLLVCCGTFLLAAGFYWPLLEALGWV